MNIPIHWGGKVANVGLIIMFIIHLILLVTRSRIPFSVMSLTKKKKRIGKNVMSQAF